MLVAPLSHSGIIAKNLRQAYTALTGIGYTDQGVYFMRGGWTLIASIDYQPQHPESNDGLFRCIKDRCGVVQVRGRITTSWTELADGAVQVLDRSVML